MQVYQSELETLRQQQRELEQRMALETATHRGRMEVIADNFDAAKPTSAEPRVAPQRRAASARSRIAPVTAEATEKTALAEEDPNAMPTADGKKDGPAPSRSDMLKRYFDAMSEYPDYAERREQRLNDVKPFSFEMREARRSKSTKARRKEERREEEERKLQEQLNSRFQANPVPPTTYLRKYELMVQEWCARKEGIRMVAEERAQRMKERAQPGKDAAEQFMLQKDAQQGSRRPRAQSAHNPKKHPPFIAKEVPIDCKVQKWDQLRLQEEERRQRIRFRAEQMLHFAKRPARMEAETKEHAKKNAEIDKTVADKKAAVDQLKKSNPNFTFKPTVDATVPDYEYLWAKDRVEIAKRKQSKPTTVPQEFKLRPTRNTTAKIETEMKRDANEGVETRWPYKSTRAKVKPTPVPKPVPESKIVRPAATKAHAMHCEVVYKSIEEKSKAEEKARKEAAARKEKERAVQSRMSPFIGGSTKTLHKETIDKKVAEKLALRKESEKESKEKLDEIKRRVQEKPPLFMEPAYLDQVAKARATTEEQVMAMLKEHGLQEQTLSAVMARDGSGADAGSIEHVTASDVEPSGTGLMSTDRIDDKSLVTPAAATTHAQPLSGTVPVATATAAPTTSATAAPVSAAPAVKKKKRRGSDSSSLSSDSFDSDSSFSSSSSY